MLASGAVLIYSFQYKEHACRHLSLAASVYKRPHKIDSCKKIIHETEIQCKRFLVKMGAKFVGVYRQGLQA